MDRRTFLKTVVVVPLMGAAGWRFYPAGAQLQVTKVCNDAASHHLFTPRYYEVSVTMDLDDLRSDRRALLEAYKREQRNIEVNMVRVLDGMS